MKMKKNNVDDRLWDVATEMSGHWTIEHEEGQYGCRVREPSCGYRDVRTLIGTIEHEGGQCGYRVREPGYGCSDVRTWDYRT